MRIFRRTLTAAAIFAVTILGALAFAQPAAAAAYARGVYAPSLNSAGNIEAWANVSTNCEGTFGCYAYVKIERLSTDPLVVRPWEFQGGQWAGEGWNKVVVPYGGCTTYRIVVDTYNDAVSNNSAGVDLGRFELNMGGNVTRYHKTDVSPSTHICMYA